MARAKRTDRAEARRRYRASIATADEVATEEAATDEAADATPTEATSRRRARPSIPPRAEAPSGGRVGIVAAFRLAAQPADIRADLAALPWLVRSTRAVWVPTVVVLASSALIATPAGRSNEVISIIWQALVVPPPMATSFLAGILAPRGSWLAGGIAGLIAGIAFTVLLFMPSSIPASGAAIDRGALTVYALVGSPMFGFAVGAFAGFYRRFLALSNPNRGRRPQGRPPRGRPAVRRR